MKRNLLAIAIPALLVAGAANASIEVWNKDGNKLSVNGRVYALNYIGDKGNTNDKDGDHTTARIGFTGETQVTDLLSGYGRFEWETNTGKDAKNEARYAFAGLNFGQYGSFDYGRNDGVLKTIGAYTDVLPEFGGDTGSYYVLTARQNAVATYRNTGFFGLVDGLNFALQYADSGESWTGNQNNEKTWDYKEAYGLNTEYAILDTGLTAGAGYATTSKAGPDSKRYNTYTFGLKYDANDLYLAANYFHQKHDENKVKGFEVVAQYGFDFEVGRLTPSLGYVQHKTDGDNGYLAKYVEVGMQYDFNKNLTAIVDYKINLLDSDDAGALVNNGTAYVSHKGNTKDTVALGLIYQF
ncbi:porin [Orbus mooreae]|uniref:porin n=1 Tax=Orbus mooreae TaxID=3074107 RepID=UPI00370DCF86